MLRGRPTASHEPELPARRCGIDASQRTAARSPRRSLTRPACRMQNPRSRACSELPSPDPLGQSVTGMAAGPPQPAHSYLAESVGFWIWGRLPVLGVMPPEGTGSEFSLFQNAPNPFGSGTVFRYRIPSGGTTAVSLAIYDVSG